MIRVNDMYAYETLLTQVECCRASFPFHFEGWISFHDPVFRLTFGNISKDAGMIGESIKVKSH